MPLIESGSEAALKKNIATEIEAGKPEKQAVAIAYSVKRANDEYPEQIVSVLPEGITTQTINESNRKFWQGQGGEGTIT